VLLRRVRRITESEAKAFGKLLAIQEFLGAICIAAARMRQNVRTLIGSLEGSDYSSPLPWWPRRLALNRVLCAERLLCRARIRSRAVGKVHRVKLKPPRGNHDRESHLQIAWRLS